MTKFSANLGFLWNDLPLPDAIRAAKHAGFHAVECHWPYEFDANEVRSALQETELKMLGINTVRGDVEAGENGLTALSGRESEARAAIDQSIDYAAAINACNIHVMAGNTSGDEARITFIENLEYACEKAKNYGLTILIEPLNHFNASGYFLSNTEQAKEIIQTVKAVNLKLMFDCYHVHIMEGEVVKRLQNLQPIIGHIQFASVPDRGTPDHGELDYYHVFKAITDMGYKTPLGAEYKSELATDETLGWMKLFT